MRSRGIRLAISQTLSDLGIQQGKSLAWSRGLGMEISPIKTQSARKKVGQTSSATEQHSNSTSDMGALRGMKALARAKS
jgi:hypothetical protein